MDIFESALLYLSLVVGAVAALVIFWGVVKGVFEVIRIEVSGRKAEEDREYQLLGKARYHIGYHLLLGLEFLIAADLIRTILQPQLEELAVLGSIVVIRIVISYFLGKEVEKLRSK